MKIYYAHHIWKYNTQVEKYEIELIKSTFPDCMIINPNGSINQSKTEKEIMEDCLDLIRDSNALIFSSLTGVVGKGVTDEVTLAYELDIPVYYICDNVISRVHCTDFVPIKNSTSKRIYAVVKTD